MRNRAAVRLAALALVAAAAAACGRGGALFRQYEYEEDVYLALDGSATVYVNSSIPALNTLRGTSLDTRPAATIERAAIRAYFSTPVTQVTRVTTSTRRNRQFVHVTIDVPDIRRLSEAAPFAWSTYGLRNESGAYVFEQSVGPAAGGDAGQANWNGEEIVAFRLHLPSKIDYHNTRREIGRGNILVWEQPLVDRLRGVALTIEARMQTQSILYRTLWLFGSTFVVVVLTFAAIIWWVLRRGASREALQPGRAQP